MVRLLDLRHFEQFRDRRDVKVVRHKDTQKDLWAMRGTGAFDSYQNGQGWDVFANVRHVISFIAERQKFGKFVGVWEVLSSQAVDGGFCYEMEELSGFNDLERRLVINWGAGQRSWAQWLHSKGNKPISEIHPPNYVDDFRGYYDIALRFDELKQIIENPESNREWHRMLSAINGVYLILDTMTGNQYIGSAYGTKGLWGRWKSYAKTRHGGNILLKGLLESDPGRFKHFQFSILRVLEPGVLKDAVIEHEVLAKRKLGSKAFGLNAN